MRKLIISALFILFITACNTGTKKSFLPSVSGKAGEVVLVMNNDYWEGRIGEKWTEICTSYVVGLPQVEPMFDMVRIPEDAFTNIFKSHRNLILMQINPQIDSAYLVIKKDVYARPQLIITLIAPNKKAYYKLLNDNGQRITDLLLSAERLRIINNYKKYEEKEIRQKIEKKHAYSLTIPKGYKLDVDSANFVWISHETPYISQAVLIYDYPYTDTMQLTKLALIKKRNEILKANVPGSLPKSYMTTDTIYPVSYEQFYLKDQYIAQLKGLWRVENDYMGGPFQSFSTVDEKRNRIITVETYVYSPKYDKRNYMRQLEAILFTLKVL